MFQNLVEFTIFMCRITGYVVKLCFFFSWEKVRLKNSSLTLSSLTYFFPSPSSMHHHTDVEGAHLSLQSSGVIISFAIEKQEQKVHETQHKLHTNPRKCHKISAK